MQNATRGFQDVQTIFIELNELADEFRSKKLSQPLKRLANDQHMLPVWAALHKHAKVGWQKRFADSVGLSLLKANEPKKTKKEQLKAHHDCAAAARRFSQVLRRENEDRSVFQFLPNGIPKLGILDKIHMSPMLSEVVEQYADLMDELSKQASTSNLMPRPHKESAIRNAFIRSMGEHIVRECSKPHFEITATIACVALDDFSISASTVRDCFRSLKSVPDKKYPRKRTRSK